MTNQYYIPYFRPVKDKGDAPVLNRYYIASDDSNVYALGSPVTLAGGSSSSNFVNGAYVNQGIQTITKATGGDGNKLLGFIVGFDTVPLNFTTAGSGINPASTTRIAIVADDPNQVFEGVCATALTAADASKNANVTIGSVNTTTRIDSSSINATTGTTSTFQLKLQGLAPFPGNEYGANNVFRFKINNHCYGNVVAGV